ncbi:MAG: ABC transporter permease [Deltaproteobacteria bacterium]|nr:ABC transporter permease [Deltaproteobacteria bacterium]
MSRQSPSIDANTRDRLLSIGFPILLLALWELAVGLKWLDERFFPAPHAVAVALYQLTVQGELMGQFWLLPGKIAAGDWAGARKVIEEGHLWISLFRIFSGFLVGAIPGVVLGVVMGMNRTIRVALDPVISAVYVLPKIAILPLVMLVFGIGELSKIVIVAIASFFLVLINTTAGVRDIEPIFFEAGRNYGANRRQMFRHILIPGALPIIFSGLRLSLGTSLIVIIAAEFVAAKYGLGYLIWFSWQTLLTENMFAGLVVIMILGALFTSGLHALERRFMPWQREERPASADTSDTGKAGAK